MGAAREAAAWREGSCRAIPLSTGRNLRRLRLEKGYSVKGLQEYLGLSCPQGVYQWQAGRSLPSVDNLYAVSRLWGVSMNEILVERESA